MMYKCPIRVVLFVVYNIVIPLLRDHNKSLQKMVSQKRLALAGG